MIRAALAPLLALLFVAGDAEGPFQKLKFDDALAQAKKENKVVFVDVYTTWCGPCKQLDATTFKDESVHKFLKENTVAIKADAEAKGAKVAAKYKVSGYPTMLLLQPDGTEIGRMVGYRDAQGFISEARQLIADAKPKGKDKKEKGKKNDAV